MTISTRDLQALPDIAGFVRLTQALAMLDAIISPEREYRYYSFDSRWSEGQMMASLRTGTGDYWFALISAAGVALHGLAHEAPTYQSSRPDPRLFAELPPEFRESFLDEPAFDTRNSTFCVWRRRGDSAWTTGLCDSADGSEELLALLDGDPARYVEFARDYYEAELEVDDVAAVYRHEPLSEALVERIHPAVTLEELEADRVEIGYGVSAEGPR